MDRRELSKILLASTAAGSLNANAEPLTSTCVNPCYPLTHSEVVAASKPTDLSYPPGNVLRWGADPTGVTDSTASIQHAMNIAWATGFYSTPWSGGGGATPVILFPPGRYKVSSTISVPTGVTVRGAAHPAHTVSHTRIIMDSPKNEDNRNKAIFRFNRATLNNGALMNSALTSTIEDLEFWFVTPGGTFDAPLSSGIGFGAYPDGGALLFDVDAADTRIINCVFQHSPAAIRIKDVPLAAQVRGDGWKGNRGVGIFIENCEFDASCTHVYGTRSYVDLEFKSCQFFGAVHRYEACTGSVVYQGGRWHGNACVDAATVPNEFGRFAIKGADIEIGGPKPFVTLNKAQLIDISQNSVLDGSSDKSWVEVDGADGGNIVSNAVNNSGCRAAPGSDISNFVAVIKLRGCRHVLVACNNITATDLNGYAGFGILSSDGSRPARGNFVNSNAISAPYRGTGWHNQSRYINAVAADKLGDNFIAMEND